MSALCAGDPNCPGNLQRSSPAWAFSSALRGVRQNCDERVFSVASTEKFVHQHQGNLWTPEERPRTEGNVQGGLLLLALEGIYQGLAGSLGFFPVTSLYVASRISVSGAVKPPPVPDTCCEMTKPLFFSSPSKRRSGYGR